MSRLKDLSVNKRLFSTTLKKRPSRRQSWGTPTSGKHTPPAELILKMPRSPRQSQASPIHPKRGPWAGRVTGPQNGLRDDESRRGEWAGLNDLPDSVHPMVLNTLQCTILHRNSFRSEGKPPKITSGRP